jgi:hypothetical protein
VKYIRCDNAGENQSLKKRVNSADWKLNIQFEFTRRDTPQHNHLAELAHASIASKGRALMAAADILKQIRYKIWVKPFQHATDLDGLVTTESQGKVASRYERWCGQLPKRVKHLRIWGESGTVKIKTSTTPKIADRGIQCMFVGYSKDRDGDCQDMWYPKTNKVNTTRDVIWLNQMHYPKEVTEGAHAVEPLDDTLDIDVTPINPGDDDTVD